MILTKFPDGVLGGEAENGGNCRRFESVYLVKDNLFEMGY